MSLMTIVFFLGLVQVLFANKNETGVSNCGDLRQELREELKTFMREEVTRMKTELLTRDRRQNEGYAFTAHHDHTEPVHPGNTLKFNKVLYNVGNLYNPLTGIATIHVSGTYLFTFSIEHWQSSELVCTLMVDGAGQVDVVIFPNGRSQQSTNAAILGLKQGQSVWIQTGEGTVLGGKYSTFAGALLF